MYKDMPELRFKKTGPSPEEEAQEGLRRAQLEADMSNQFSRGWQSSGLGINASDLYSQSNLAETEGDMRKAQTLRAQADAMSAQAQAWAPRVKNFTDIGSIGDAADWAAGAAGNLRSSIAPMVGGMAGTAAGGLAGLALKNPALGAKIGGAIGALTPSIQMSRDEIIAGAMNNPEAAGRTAEEIRRTGWIGGVPAGLLEAAVPWAIGHGLATAGRKALTNELKKTGVAKAVAKATALGAGGEAATEFGQDIIGQTAQNYLARKDLTDYDYVAAANAAAAGAVGGALMGGGGKMVQAGANRAINRGEQVADTAARVARDPGQAVGDAIADAGAAAGRAAGWVEGKLEGRRNVATAEAALKAMAEGKLGEGDQAAVVQGIKDGAYDTADPGIGLRPEDGDLGTPEGMTQADKRIHARATAYADTVMSPDYANDFSADEKAAAARFKAGATDYHQFRYEIERAAQAKRARSIAESDFGGSKQSLETTERGTESFALADLWLNQADEGQKFFTEAGEDGRTLAAQLVEWVRSDFGKEHSDDGSVFIPSRLIDELGTGAAKAVAEVTRLVDKQFGLKDHNTFHEVREEIMQRAKNASNDTAMITSSLTPLAEASMNPQRMQVLTELLRSSKGVVGAAARKGLEEMFGANTPRVLNHFNPKNIGRRYGRPGENIRSPQGQGDGRVVEGIDENGDLILSDEVNYDADETSAQGYEVGGLGRENEREGITYHGVGESNNPFDTTTQGQQLKTALAGLREDLGQRTRELGIWSDVRESFKGDEQGLRDAEAELIFNYGDFSREAAEAEKMGLPHSEPSLDEISSWAANDKRRLAKLFEIDKRYKILKSEPLGSLSDPGKLMKGQGPGTIDDFKYKIPLKDKEKGVTEADLTAQKGFVFLERKIGDRVSHFPVSLRTLSNKFGHAATAESPVVEGQSGAAALNKQVMSMLSNLIYSGESFTGRVGFRKEAGGPLQWLKQSGRQFVVDGSKNAEPVGLPGETKLGQGKSGAPVTADDARSAAAEARRYGDRESQVPYTESHKERVRILRGLVDAAKAAQQKTVLNTLPTKFAEAALRSGSEKRIGAAYLTLRNQFDGEIDDMGGHNRAGTTVSRWQGDRNVTITDDFGAAAKGRRGVVVDDFGGAPGNLTKTTDVEARTRTISRSNRSADSMLKDERTGKNILASESEASVTTSYRREDPAVKGKADDRVATGGLTRPLPLELGERLAKYAALFRKSGAMGQAKKGATGKEIADLAEKLLSPKDRSEFQKLRSTRGNDLAAKKSWVMKHSTWLPEVPGTIHRDERGAATGLGTDAQFGGYGGKSSPAKSPSDVARSKWEKDVAQLTSDIAALRGQVAEAREMYGSTLQRRESWPIIRQEKQLLALEAKLGDLKKKGPSIKPSATPKHRAAGKQLDEASARSRAKEAETEALVADARSNLAEFAEPPAFAKAKESAKAEGAHLVYAPQGVEGSFASRLAKAAKGVGMLANPRDKTPLDGQIVYVSVPGASRKFEGMSGFIDGALALLSRGAVLRTDTEAQANRSHNAPGEGRLRKALIAAGYQPVVGEHFDSWGKDAAGVAKRTNVVAERKVAERKREAAERERKIAKGEIYEVSTKGDKRFSALVARLRDGRTIEEAYQLDVKGYRSQGNDWKLGKGKPPLAKMSPQESYAQYKALWEQWVDENPRLMQDLVRLSKGKVLQDKFARGPINQARALEEIIAERGLDGEVLAKAQTAQPKAQATQTQREDQYLIRLLDAKDHSAVLKHINEMSAERLRKLQDIVVGFVEYPEKGALFKRNPQLLKDYREGTGNFDGRWDRANDILEIIADRLEDLDPDTTTKFSLAADTPHRRTTAGERAVSRATDQAFREQLSAVLKTLGFRFDAGAGPVPTTHAARLMDLARKRITSFSANDKRAISEAAGAIAYLMMGHKDFADLRQLVNKDHFKQKKAYAARLMSQGLSRGDALTQANTLVVADLIRENFDERNKSPLTKIVEAVKRLLGKLSEVNKTELMETVDRAIGKILSSPEYLKGETKSGFEKVSFEQALSEDPHARNVLETMLKDQGVSLTGSLALSTQGTVYRQKGGLLHDLDFSLLSSEAEPSATKTLMEAFPETVVINSFSSSDPYGKITDTRIHIVPPKGLAPSDLRFAGRKLVGYSLRDKGGKVVGTFRVTSDGREVKHGERAMLVDFFIPQDSEKRAAVPHTFTGADGKPVTGLMMPAAPTFVAKLSMGRDKDIWDYANYVPHDGDTKFSKENSDNNGMTPEQEQAARDFIKHVLGDSVNLEIKKMLKHGAAGTWTPNRKQGVNTIRLAMGSKILGTAYHESLHEFFDMLGKHGAENVKEMLTRAATNPINLRKLERLLHKHPRAVEQLKDPEEALAFTFQYYQMGLLEVGPQTKGVFELIKKGLRAIASIVSERFREENRKRIAADKDALEMRAVLDQFASGALAEPETRSPLIDRLIENTKAHDEALGHIGDKWAAFTNAAGKFVFSAEAVMKATNSPALRDLVAQFHHEAGTAMTTFNVTDAKNVKGAYLGALRGETNRWMNRLENILNKYEKEDLELARESLSTGRATFAPNAAKAAAEITEFYRDMAKYMADSDVRRLEKGRWEKVTSRKDYGITQIWDVNEVVKNREQFISDLMTHHMDELEAIAEKAKAEVDHRRYAGANTASQTMLESGEQDVITPEMVAEAIMVRVINSNGKIDMEEHESQLGITPVATAVNKRALDWIDQKVFDKYKSKDIANILSTYTRSMVKRAEYQKRFGYSGEQIRQAVDEAILHEIGGKSLVEEAKAQYDKELGSWDGKYDTQPNLRDIGLKLQEEASGEYPAEALAKAVKKLTPAFKAIQAMEGTLGNDMSPTMRQANSWVNTYQSMRLLSTMLFTSINDVMGIVANGGELKDAWSAFASGMREIRNTIAKKKGDNPAGLRAEEWGAVDASSFMDSLGQTYGSTFMTSGAKRVSDTFFKYTGAEGWNRGIRMVAANVGERIITDWAKNGADMKDPAVKARVERLFGEGADPKNIKLDEDGNLDITDPMNQAAVQRWVMDSVVTPTAANRPTWGSDPRFMAMMHLKNYTYTLHRVVLKGALDQARLGNYRPLATMMLGYAPVMIGAGAVKEMLIPGDEPYWMKKGLTSYLDYGWSTAGVLGVPQMFWHMRKDPAQALGPMADQIQDWLSVPFMDDHTVMKEALKSMPAGTLFRRMA